MVNTKCWYLSLIHIYIEPAATAYYLKKYDFTIYDKDVYDGIKSTNESYIVQD